MATKKPKVVRNRPEGITTKEELVSYINANLDTEYPFNPNLWEKCLVTAEEGREAKKTMTTSVVYDADGEVIETKVKKKKFISDNPVAIYWKYMGLAQYRRQGQDLRLQKMLDEGDDIVVSDFEEEEEKEIDVEVVNPILKENNVVTMWISGIKSEDERAYLKKRVVNYYDEYDINDGADLVILYSILGLELDVFRLNKIRSKGEMVDYKTAVALAEQLNKSLTAMKWTRKERSTKNENAENNFTNIMASMCEKGSFDTKDLEEIDKDEIDYLLENIPQFMENMDWRTG